jgi:osmotically-inducible protein OsmY
MRLLPLITTGIVLLSAAAPAYMYAVARPVRPLIAIQLSVPIETTPDESRARKPDDQVKKDIQDALANEPSLKGLSINVTVDAKHIILGGELNTITQRDTALAIAKQHADGRQVIDDFHVMPK